ncbi:MAG: hypothetical protein Fur0028_10510 [Bacteroidales bacterium]
MEKKNKAFLILFIFFVIVNFSFYKAFGQINADSVLNKTFKQIESIKTLRFNITSRERISNHYKIDKGFYKISKMPILYYYKQLIPPTSAEVFVNSETYPMALVNAHKTLVPNLILSPYGEVLRDTRHHNLYQAGYDYFKNILLFLKDKYNIKWASVTTMNNDIKINQYNCYKLTITNPYFKIIQYTVKEKTTLQQLALKLNICDYHIIQMNASISSVFHTLKPGQIITLPSDYARKIILYIDKTLYIPIKIEVYDNIGLFEEYLFEDIELNPVFKNEEFSQSYNEYEF